MTADFIIVTTTTATEADAMKIAHDVIAQKLVACVEIHQARSFYSWKGKVCDEVESVLVMKTRAVLYPVLEARIKSLHPYELPQIIATPITNGLTEYLDWVKTETKGE
jgi:periplasmic divalent cation tolerance protein